MKKIFGILLLILACCQFHAQNTISQIPDRPENKYILKEMKFETDAAINPYSAKSPWVTKWIAIGNTEKDSIVKAEGKYSLKLMQGAGAYYYTDAARIVGDSLNFSGKFRYAGASNGKLYLYILQKDRYESVERPPIPDTLILTGLEGKNDWQSFNIKAKLKNGIQEIRFGISTKDISNVWIDDWDIKVDASPVYNFIKTQYPAEKDKEFESGSKINFGELTPQMAKNLDILGRVWGFLKYYHPAVIDGDKNWDFELFRIMPSVAKASNNKELNRILINFIDGLGDFNTKEYVINDPELYSCYIDLNWLNDKQMFDQKVIDKLNKIKNADRPDKVNYYVIPFRGGARDRNFRAEKTYQVSWSDQGFRLLTLFRFWNVMEYNFPYKYLTDHAWTDVLPTYLPKFLKPESEADFNATLYMLTAEINDSHGRLMFNGTLEGTPAAAFRQKRLPVGLTESAEGKIVVFTDYPELNAGDVITEVEGKPVKKIMEDLAPYTTASNPASLSRNMRGYILAYNSLPLSIKIERDGKIIPVELRSGSAVSVLRKTMDEYKKEHKDIVFLNVGRMQSTELVTIIKDNMDAKGIVFDLREYPRDFFSFFKLTEILLPDTAINLWFSSQILSYPGNYKKYNECPIGYKNPDYFKGKVAVLVNEGTQSLGEMTAIALRNAPNAAVIGSQTSGADGNATSFNMPYDGMAVGYTVLGAYYPNWGQCQRTGVKIDIEVRPTVEDIKNKKDVLIEKAIEYIRN